MHALRIPLGATLILASLAGCAGTTHRREDIDDPGLVDADVIGTYEIRKAAEEMCRKIAKQRTWPPYVPVTPDGKPQVRITKIINRTTVHFDVRYLKNELENVMNEQGAVWLVAEGGPGGALEEVHEEREYSQSGMTADSIEHGQEDATGLILYGEIVESSIDQRNVAQRDYVFYLKLYDTRKSRAVITVRKGFRKVKERNLFGG